MFSPEGVLLRRKTYARLSIPEGDFTSEDHAIIKELEISKWQKIMIKYRWSEEETTDFIVDRIAIYKRDKKKNS